VKDLNREITESLQLEMGCESSGVALEELRPLILHENHSYREEVTVIAKMTIRKNTCNCILVLANETYNCILALSATRR